VYPSSFKVEDRSVSRDGTTHSRPSILSGQAWSKDYVILSWDDAVHGALDPADGHNLVFHEFAHHLDASSGKMDGTPAISDEELCASWKTVFASEYKRLCKDLAEGENPFINSYAATNKAEFFAVVTEIFFEQPEELRERHEKLYELLRAYYAQDLLDPPNSGTRKVSRKDWPSFIDSLRGPLSHSDKVLKKGEETLKELFLGGTIVVTLWIILVLFFPLWVTAISRAAVCAYVVLLFLWFLSKEMKNR
jgi:hypothetical protein